MARKKKYNDPNQSSLVPFFDAEGFMDEICEIVKTSIIDKDRSATGKAVESLKVVKYNDEQWAIQSVPYLYRIQEGNPPRGRERKAIGGGYTASPVMALVSKLQDGWLQSRNLPLESAWPIAVSIVKNGDRTWQNGGEDVWDSNVVNFIDNNIDKYLNIKQYLNFETI